MNTAAFLLAVSFLPFFEAKNTAANYILVPPDEDAAEVSTEKPDLTVQYKCPVCEGKGTLLLVEPDYGQFSGRLGTPNKKRTVGCPFCGGRRKIESFTDPTELELQVARDREKFESDHLAKGDVPVGSAFVPRDVYDSLDESGSPFDDKEDRERNRELKKRRKDRLKLVETTYGEPCRSCHWTGIEACGKCDGKGWTGCPNKDCKEGWSVEKTTTKTTKRSSGGNNLNGGWRSSGSRNVTRTSEKINVSVCQECGGAGKILCPKCGGRRAGPCGKCKGLGTKKKGH